MSTVPGFTSTVISASESTGNVERIARLSGAALAHEVGIELARQAADDAARLELGALGGLDLDVEPDAVGAAPADGLLEACGRHARVLRRKPAARVKRPDLEARELGHGACVADRAAEALVVHQDGNAVLGEHGVRLEGVEAVVKTGAETLEGVFRRHRARTAVGGDAGIGPGMNGLHDDVSSCRGDGRDPPPFSTRQL